MADQVPNACAYSEDGDVRPKNTCECLDCILAHLKDGNADLKNGNADLEDADSEDGDADSEDGDAEDANSEDADADSEDGDADLENARSRSCADAAVIRSLLNLGEIYRREVCCSPPRKYAAKPHSEDVELQTEDLSEYPFKYTVYRLICLARFNAVKHVAYNISMADIVNIDNATSLLIHSYLDNCRLFLDCTSNFTKMMAQDEENCEKKSNIAAWISKLRDHVIDDFDVLVDCFEHELYACETRVYTQDEKYTYDCLCMLLGERNPY